jgi:hypothetical protein
VFPFSTHGMSAGGPAPCGVTRRMPPRPRWSSRRHVPTYVCTYCACVRTGVRVRFWGFLRSKVIGRLDGWMAGRLDGWTAGRCMRKSSDESTEKGGRAEPGKITTAIISPNRAMRSTRRCSCTATVVGLGGGHTTAAARMYIRMRRWVGRCRYYVSRRK